MKKKESQELTEKKIKSLKKGRFSTRFLILFFTLGFFAGVASVTLLLVGFGQEENSIKLAGFILLGVALLCLVFGCLPKKYKPSVIDSLNDDLFKGTLRASEYQVLTFKKNTLLNNNLEAQIVETISQSVGLNRENLGPVIITGIQKSETMKKNVSSLSSINEAMKVNGQVRIDNTSLGHLATQSYQNIPFRGVLLAIKPLFPSLIPTMEIREIKDSISPFIEQPGYKNLQIDELPSFLLYTPEVDTVKEFFLEKKKREALNNILTYSSQGIALSFKKDGLVFVELYGFEDRIGLIDKKNTTPGQDYEKKKEVYQKLDTILCFIEELLK